VACVQLETIMNPSTATGLLATHRRRLLQVAAITALVPACAATAIARPRSMTPAQSLGPFYPRELPLDRDNDLTRVAGQAAQARGQITELTGQVTDLSGKALAGVRIELWQVNAFGRYHHPYDTRDRPIDPGFQGYGQFVTDAEGRYRFRTIRPVPYPGRAPHIHLALSGPGFRRLATQMYVEGSAENARDFLLNSVRDRAQRDSLVVPFRKYTGTDGAAAFTANFDVVLAQDGRASLFHLPRAARLG